VGSSPDCACLSCTRVSTSSASPHPLITAKRHPSAGYGKKAPIRWLRQKGTPSAAYGEKGTHLMVTVKRHPSAAYGKKGTHLMVTAKRHPTPSAAYGQEAPYASTAYGQKGMVSSVRRACQPGWRPATYVRVPPRPVESAKRDPLDARAEPALAPTANGDGRALLCCLRSLLCLGRQRRVKVRSRHVAQPEACVELAQVGPVHRVPPPRHKEEVFERRARSQPRELEGQITTVAPRALDLNTTMTGRSARRRPRDHGVKLAQQPPGLRRVNVELCEWDAHRECFDCQW